MPTSMGNREAIRLYRDILRGCRRFHWCNEHGVPWNKLLRDSARKEFEQAREEKDPLIVARLLVMGRQCLNDTLYKFDETQRNIVDKMGNSLSENTCTVILLLASPQGGALVN